MFLFFYSCLIHSCSESDTNKIISELESFHEIENRFDRVIFIPYRGCSNCVAKAFNYLKINSLNNDLIVFINYSSEKEVRIRLNVFNIYVPNSVFIEESSKLINYGISSYYPTILELKEEKGQLIVASPSNLKVWDELN